jgi:hypothetical protein
MSAARLAETSDAHCISTTPARRANLIRLEFVDLDIRCRNNRLVPLVHQDPRDELRVLQTAKRLFQPISREMERLKFTATDIGVSQCAFDRSESHESGAKCFDGFGVFCTGNLAFGAKLFQGAHDCPNALASAAGSGVFAGGSGCFTFAAALKSATGCKFLISFLAALSADSVFI